MDFIAEVRRRHFVSGESISSIARGLKLSRPTVRKALKAETDPLYQRQHQPVPKLGDFQTQLTDWMALDAKLPKRQRRTAQRLFECLQAEGYQGSYGPVQRFALNWKQQAGTRASTMQAFVPLAFPAGGTCQFDWSHEVVVLGGVLQTIKVAHFRLAYSRQMFIVAYPRETQEMVLDAHVRAFAFFGGVPKRMVYDKPVYSEPEKSALRDYIKRYGHESALIIGYPDFPTGLMQGLSLWRSDVDDPFIVPQRQLLEYMMPHLAEALNINQALSLKKMSDSAGALASGNVAIATHDGALHFVGTGFAQLIESEWPGSKPYRLPGILYSTIICNGNTTFTGRHITISAQSIENLFFFAYTATFCPELPLRTRVIRRASVRGRSIL